MFDIGFWEIALIIVVALLVVGPEEFPSLVRNASTWLGKMRRFMSDVKGDLDKELNKAEELKKLMDKEAIIAKLHENIDGSSPAVSVESEQNTKSEQVNDSGGHESPDPKSVEKSPAKSESISSPSSGQSRPSHETQK